MSGIIGSKLNHRGSGLVGSVGTDGQHLLSAGAGKTNVFETVSVPAATDLTPVRQDILTLALKQAVQENSTKFNLPNSAITKFEADADFNLAGSTTIDRHSLEYIWAAAGGVGAFSNDGNTDLLLHGDGSDASTTFTDSSSNAYTFGVQNDTQIDTAQKKLGTGSMLFDGTGDALTCAHADFDAGFGTNDFTIECWIRGSSLSSKSGMIIAKGGRGFITADYEGWSLYKSAAGQLQWRPRSSGAEIVNIATANLSWSDDTWYHIALVRDYSDAYYIYINGVSTSLTVTTGSVTTAITTNSARDLTVGMASDSAAYFLDGTSGWIDELRISDNVRYPSGTTFTPNSTLSASATGTALGTTNVPTSAVTDVSGVMLLKDAYGTTTLGTDVKAYFTADNSNWTEATSYADAGTFSTGIKMIKLGKTTCTSGSDVRWKAVWANQVSTSKEAHIYGIGLNY